MAYPNGEGRPPTSVSLEAFRTRVGEVVEAMPSDCPIVVIRDLHQTLDKWLEWIRITGGCETSC